MNSDARLILVGKLDIKGMDIVKRVYSPEGICPTLTDMQGGGRQPKVMNDLRIRKLTPKECWRLMGFEDSDFEKAKAVNSNTQLYKQAGNSIVVDVLEHLFKGLEGIIDMRFYTDNPVCDAERYHEYLEDSGKKIGVCEHCSDPIFEGEDYYDIHGDMIHEDCLREWADEQYKVS